MLVEYIYTDDKRLNSYVEQFASPIHFEKFSQWKAAIGLTGPTAEGTQTGFARPLTTHEKVEGFTRFIVEEGLFVKDRQEGRYYEDGFDDTFPVAARRIVIAEHNLAMWFIISELEGGKPKKGDTIVFLIEDYGGSPQERVMHYSSHSMLRLLIREISQGKGIDHRTLSELLEAEETADKRFAADPFGYLQQLGASVGPIQTIRSIYRVRADSHSVTPPRRGTRIIYGYPIFIERAQRSIG